MLRVTGDLVKGLQTAFAENWLEASGEILAEEDFLLTDVGEPRVVPPGSGLGMVINSSPSAGGSTQARILFQVLVASARKSIEICSPYFLPDGSLCSQLQRAAQRGVAVSRFFPRTTTNPPIARPRTPPPFGRPFG